MAPLSDRKILLAVGAGIAAYKIPELIRRLRQAGAQVEVAPTPRALDFVTPLTLAAVNDRPPRLSGVDPAAPMAHIDLARWADALLVAPASADLIARLALGLADDLPSTLALACQAPLIVAPAMNQAMWRHAATRANVERLRARGAQVWGPAEGEQACGETGPGRMLEPEELVLRLAALWAPRPLHGRRVLVTAGPTREPLDPVRYLGNRSSGKMGYALAEAAREAGADVVLVSGPTALPDPPGIETLRVERAEEMREAVLAHAPSADIFIAAAAVADYRPARPAPQKIKKAQDRLRLELVRNPDILAEVAAGRPRPFCVGFAAETDDLERHARAKLADKGLDMVCANRVGEGLGFDADDNALWVAWPGGETTLPRQPKPRLARALMDLVIDRYEKSRSDQTAGSPPGR